MPRLARVVVPGIPHHVTQRGNRRQQTFFRDSDYSSYKRYLSFWCRQHGVSIWSYCLMPNHVHLIVSPATSDGLAAAIGETHSHYTGRINERKEWKGFLWQGRFSSMPMDELHLLHATRYVLLNPIRAGLVKNAIDWPHSSLRAHLVSETDGIVDTRRLAERIEDWEQFLSTDTSDEEADRLRNHTRMGRPLGGEAFLAELEGFLGRRIQRERK